jgi:hypothetical protein
MIFQSYAGGREPANRSRRDDMRREGKRQSAKGKVQAKGKGNVEMQDTH